MTFKSDFKAARTWDPETGWELFEVGPASFILRHSTEPSIEFWGEILVNRYGSPSPMFAQVAVIRAMGRIGEPWRAFNDNCEHFIRWAYGMKAESPQAVTLTALGVLASGLLLMVRFGR